MTYEELVGFRKTCRVCMERSAEEIHNGSEFAFDPPVISYWSQWLGHRQPYLLIVGQDFGNVSYFIRHRGMDGPENETNENLRKLLLEAGIKAEKAPDADPAVPVFLTNSILCLKSGPMNAPIKERWVDACAQNHLASLIRYLNPKIIVAMGKMGWRAVRRVFALAQAPPAITVAAGQSWGLETGTRVFPVVHCSGLGMVNRPWPQQVADWQRIGAALGKVDPDPALL
jgi:uracil-DNA glycosylase